MVGQAAARACCGGVASARHSSTMPARPREAPAIQRVVRRRWSMKRSASADASGAEPIDTTVPTATPVRRMDV
jgi:hypothetical protein